MDLEDFLEPEIAVTAVIAAAIFSPKARKAIRKGVVYATAGALVAGDAISSFTKNVAQGAQRMRTPAEAQGSQQEGSGG